MGSVGGGFGGGTGGGAGGGVGCGGNGAGGGGDGGEGGEGGNSKLGAVGRILSRRPTAPPKRKHGNTMAVEFCAREYRLVTAHSSKGVSRRAARAARTIAT